MVQLERGKPLAAVRNLAHNALRPEAIESFWCAHGSSSHTGLLLLYFVDITEEGYCVKRGICFRMHLLAVFNCTRRCRLPCLIKRLVGWAALAVLLNKIPAGTVKGSGSWTVQVHVAADGARGIPRVGLDGVLGIPQVVPRAQRLHVPRGAHPGGLEGCRFRVGVLSTPQVVPRAQWLHVPPRGGAWVC